MNYNRFIGNVFFSPEDKVEILSNGKTTPQYADVIRRILFNNKEIMLNVVIVRPNVGKNRLAFYVRCRVCRHNYKLITFMNDFNRSSTTRVRLLTNIGVKCSCGMYFYM